MARGGRVGQKDAHRNNVNCKRRRVEDSDGDYNVSEDEVYESEDEYCSSLQDDASSSEEERVEKKVRKVGRSGLTRGSKRRKRNTVLNTRKKKVYSERDVDDNDEVVNVLKRKKSKLIRSKEEDDDEFEIVHRQKKVVRTKRKPRVINTSTCGDGRRQRQKKNTVPYTEQEEEDEDFYDSEEFTTPDEADLPSSKKKTVTKRRTKRRKRKGQVSKRTKSKRPVKKRALRKKRRSRPRNKVRSTILQKEKTIAQRNMSSEDSDSDFSSSGSSDCGFTISEEEREQVREARELSRQLTSRVRSSNSLRVNKEETIISLRKDHPDMKGKEKVVDTEMKEGQQVCGICFSEEGKRTIRGILSCCSHYFCFACIIEWSKVESRCPLCKQRFSTIRRSGRADGRHHLKDAAIAVPKRDQVYQPSEEEVRGYLDPYASVTCSECDQGCDDSLMLLCDLCDSSAHTYCVGLGREVPEGNWYCNACRPTVVASSSEQPVNLEAHDNLGSSSIAADQGSSYYTGAYEPVISIGHLGGHSRLNRDSISHSQVISPGSGAATLLGRRRIQRHIYQFLNNRNINLESHDAVTPITATNSLGAQGCHQNLVHQVRTLPNSSHAPQLSSAVGPGLRNQASASANTPSVGLPSGEFSGIRAGVIVDLGQQRLQGCSGRSSDGVNANILHSQLSDVGNPGIKKEQVQSMVKHQLKCLSRNTEIGYNTFKEIARTSTHTVLAAFGLEHRPQEVYPVQSQPLICGHPERVTNQPTYLNGEQCPSCLNRFVRNVVQEVLCVRIPTPTPCIDQTIRKE